VTDKTKSEETRRVFEIERDGKNLKFFLGMPSAEDVRKAEWHYSKVYNQALIDGVSTQAEMLDILTKRGLYGPEYHTHIEELQRTVAERIVEMETAEEPNIRRNLAIEVAKARDELFQWNQRLNGPLSNTCEQMAEDSKAEYLTSVMTQKEDGSRVWNDYDAFLAEPDQGLSMKARLEVLLLMQGLDSDFLEKTPERQVLMEIARAEATPKLEASKEKKADSEDKPKKTTKRGRRPKAKSKK
jgi:hypothetical protein